jgi:hypothetical protein
MNSIKFNKKNYIIFKIIYMIEIYSHEIKHQSKNKNLFETAITLKKIKNKKIMQLISQPVQY